MLRHNSKYRDNAVYLRPLELGEKHRVDYGNSELWITLIDSNHCPGSVMFLIESDSKAVLVTGDIRAESWWCNQLPRVEQLIPYTSGIKELDMIYLDTTYSYRGEPYIEMMFNHKGLEVLTHFLKNYPNDDSVQFYFKDETIGCEDVWLYLKAALNERIHSKREIRLRTNALVDCDGLPKGLKNTLITQGGSRFHLCGRDPRSCEEYRADTFNIMLKACINISLDQMMLANLPLPFHEQEEGLEFIRETPEGHKIYKYTNDSAEKMYLLPARGNELLTDEILFFYSRHSSYEECRHFLSLFSVKEVYPIVEDSHSWDHGFQMKRQFGDLCNSDTFLYDSKYLRLYGTPQHVPDSQPWIHNNLSPQIELKWEQSVLQFTSSRELSFKGQASFKNVFNDNPSKETRCMDHQYRSLQRKGQIVQGMKQYRVQKNINDIGPQWLNDHYKQDSLESCNSQVDDCDMARAMMKLNEEIASRQVSLTTSTASRQISLEDGSPGSSFGATHIAIEARTQENPDSEHPQSRCMVSHPSLVHSEMTELDKLKRLLQSSPPKNHKKTRMNVENIQRYEEKVKNDEDFGFFGVHLQVLNDTDNIT
jgi:hypothetical protein